ncbi:Uu.00g135150.m01.CDS01 [Anthostomella pinea]|uniref:Uu.00g135150.m01.CDS01 n=1 Tax=Anthostomella pinea TaxID=933095 RepID=A0AAI8VP53_9PEZI|nr:Uu.00g135150.m01.CDS01 [Anthostomella pinea]
MPQPAPPPELNIPASKHTVDVSIIDTTGFVGNMPVHLFMNPVLPGYDKIKAVCYAFSIKHSNPEQPSKYDHLLFDLGLRKDVENAPKSIVDGAKQGGWDLKVEKNVADILQENGDGPAKVGGIIWSHYHFDHTGDPQTFPSSTDLIVGPGFKERFIPAFPTVEDSPVDERAWKDRNLREIDFATEGKGLKLGQYDAFDFYGDGSFYLINSPGHATGHMCGLARTSADPPEFIMMGGDIAHHGGEFRPTQWLPLPENIQPNPTVPPYTKDAPVCPGALFEAIHPTHSSTEPFMHPNGSFHDDKEVAMKSVGHFQEFDANDNIMAIIAHDTSIFDLVEKYPKPANGWRQKGWKEQGRWQFLNDFDTSVGKGKEG